MPTPFTPMDVIGELDQVHERLVSNGHARDASIVLQAAIRTLELIARVDTLTRFQLRGMEGLSNKERAELLARVDATSRVQRAIVGHGDMLARETREILEAVAPSRRGD
ncbi:hypothetical protein KUU78_30970 (plasmid) [Pseudomonas aeruginosa]|uniref:hypothetical protein n=1 Tax=Pseudomonadota TaxID=1224 RepID=UPI0015CE3B78|nr:MULTISPECIES: hypothetical protein [Pseudomonadota]MBY9629142.1 hypothetical protein [Pseudomonas aeruginosa]MBY9844539.1 hypothetical protein [Pseudomonas aeruginosa]MCO8627599.1 hypothetical protein [Burkholderia multivorans]NYS16969.1 hypothetical protein [Achromobacter xylosoxidans]QZV20409.1 hypothetical protein ITG68_30535 [Pseudomonas aeruginosa]